MNAQLQLLFHADHLKFALIREFGDWRQEFGKLRDALSFAKSEGAKELPFLILDEGELFSESIITVEPLDRAQVISNSEDLAAFVRKTLAERGDCRVFANVLDRCWNSPRPNQEQAIERFASEHGWNVKVYEPAGYGVVAEFCSGQGGHGATP